MLLLILCTNLNINLQNVYKYYSVRFIVYIYIYYKIEQNNIKITYKANKTVVVQRQTNIVIVE